MTNSKSIEIAKLTLILSIPNHIFIIATKATKGITTIFIIHKNSEF